MEGLGFRGCFLTWGVKIGALILVAIACSGLVILRLQLLKFIFNP